MKVIKLTLEQKELLIGRTYDDVQYFNPTLDADGNWFISNEEVNQCIIEDLQWVKQLPEIDYNPIINDFII